MSAAAVAYGVKAQANPYVPDKYDPERWVPGWQATSTTIKEYF